MKTQMNYDSVKVGEQYRTLGPAKFVVYDVDGVESLVNRGEGTIVTVAAKFRTHHHPRADCWEACVCICELEDLDDVGTAILGDSYLAEVTDGE